MKNDPNLAPEERAEWTAYELEYKKHAEENLVRNQEYLEKQLVYICAGALTLSIGFIKDIVPDFLITRTRWIMGVAWGILALTIVANCVSFWLAAKYADKTIAELEDDEVGYNEKGIRVRGVIINRINFWSLVAMGLGVLAILIYISLNIIFNKLN